MAIVIITDNKMITNGTVPSITIIIVNSIKSIATLINQNLTRATQEARQSKIILFCHLFHRF